MGKIYFQTNEEDILEYLDGDEVYCSTTGLQSTQYLSMLIEFQIGAKQPPPDINVNILDVEELLEDKEKRISTILKELALLEEENIVHCQEAARASLTTLKPRTTWNPCW